MKLSRNTFGVVTALVLMGAVPPARAQMAVVDVGAIAQLIEQVETARSHLEQAYRQYESMTGGRGMEELLAGTVRNYLPPDWQALEQALNGMAGDYSALAGQLAALVERQCRADTRAARAHLGPGARAARGRATVRGAPAGDEPAGTRGHERAL